MDGARGADETQLQTATDGENVGSSVNEGESAGRGSE